ncbi:hypothetical protein CPLU01_05673 [Colletotrichum plurivorum]|uniref:Uncharacterized protein n=1 Tax=Colletotrichum plurivorum TaxID=2175906 RepID=A0A8H6KKC3_9PEZI|nr:hypothetical protein CPLU01_05673 [Colletotrichum plurivorum]
MRVRLFHVLSPLLLGSGAASQGCFFPNGSPDSKGKKCFDPQDGKASACCWNDDYCLTNGLCLEPFKYTLYRASCTDAAYKSDGCPTMCLNYSTSAHRGVWPCKDGNLWTCEDSSELCKVSTFRMQSPGNIIFNTVAKSNLDADLSSANASVNAGVSVGAAAGIGAGVGIPLLIVIGILTILLLRERKKFRAANSTTAGVAPETQSSKPGTTMSSPGWHHHEPTRGHGEGATELATGVRHELPQY